MSVNDWLAVAGTFGGAIGGAITIAARLIVIALKEARVSQSKQFAIFAKAQEEKLEWLKASTSAITELRLDMRALASRIDTLIEVATVIPRDPRDSSRDIPRSDMRELTRIR